jgi:hypothetical protein
MTRGDPESRPLRNHVEEWRNLTVRLLLGLLSTPFSLL